MTDTHLKKYHQAAYTYIIMGIVYMTVFYTTMPSHYFSLAVKILIPLVGTLLMGLSWFVYKGYRTFTIVLTVIYAIRSMVAAGAMIAGDNYVAVSYVIPILLFTFYMLGRAAWDWRP